MNKSDKILIQIISILMIAFCLSCGRGSGFSDIPAIQFESLSKDTMVQGRLLEDSLTLVFSFRDGDGNLGTGAQGLRENIILTDNRNGEVYTTYKVPDLPPSGAAGGIEGSILLKLYTECCIFPPLDSIPACSSVPTLYPSNQFTVSIRLNDDDGNESNVVQSSLITILCN